MRTSLRNSILLLITIIFICTLILGTYSNLHGSPTALTTAHLSFNYLTDECVHRKNTFRSGHRPCPFSVVPLLLIVYSLSLLSILTIRKLQHENRDATRRGLCLQQPGVTAHRPARAPNRGLGAASWPDP